VSYYVGLLTAASFHGAGHQRAQEFQVVTATVLRPLTVGRVRIRFFFRRRMECAVTEQVKTSGGYIPVSTAEMTAYDLVRYRKGAGSIDHAATVLSELAERIDAKRLLAVARKGEEMPVIQRLGYLLEAGGHADLAGDLASLVERAGPRFVRLEPRSPEEVRERNPRWRVLVNTTVEAEA
jgi:predicted transcriptional regulator of viral defense system